MNKKIKFAIIGLLLAVLILIIINFQIDREIIKPPPAILKIDGKEQISGIGSYCWMGTWKGLCADMIGLPTAQEPLIASSPFSAHLRLPLQEPPYELRLNVVRVKDEDELNFSKPGWRWWKEREEKLFILSLEPEQDIELSLESGLYVLSIGAWWNEKGSASYGFLVEVRANGTGAVSTKIQSAKITGDIGASIGYSGENQTPTSNMNTSPAIMEFQTDAGTIGTKVVITGTGFTARDNNIAFRRAPEDAPIAGYQVGYINNLISSDGRTIEFVIPELLGACAFPLPVTTPVTGCPAIGIPFKPGNQTYPVSVVNQNGTSNSVNFTVSR
jgi:hypothetical protein